MGFLAAAAALVRHHGMPGVFVVMLLENLGVPLPTEIGYLVARDQIDNRICSYALALTVITAGHMVGAAIAYAIGLGGRGVVVTRLRSHRRIVETQARLERWYARYGWATVLLTRFVGYVRPWSSLVAGLAHTRALPFFVSTLVGTVVFNVIALALTKELLEFWGTHPQYRVAVLVAAVFIFFGALIWETIRELLRKWRERAR